MVDFSIPTPIQNLVTRIHQFLEDVVIPLEAHADEDPQDGLPLERLKIAREQAKAAGLWCPTMPADLGGMGLSITEIIPVFEAAGRSLLGPLVMGCAAPDRQSAPAAPVCQRGTA